MSNRRKQIGALAATAAFAVLCIVGAIVWWPTDAEPPLNLPATAEEGFAFMTSAAFTGLPDYRQEAYRREVRRLLGEMPDDRRAAFIARYRGSAELAKGLDQLQYDPVRPAMQEYFKTAPDQRQAVLDKHIDRMERFRALGGLGRSLGGAGNSGRPEASPEMRDYMRDRVEGQIQDGNPQETARMMEFMKAFRQRRLDRGLPIP